MALATMTPPPVNRQARQNPVKAGLEATQAQYNKVKEAHQLVDHARFELDELAKLADTVIPDDVLKAAGRLVGHGFGSANMAELLSTMPSTGGAPLAAWIAQHDVAFRQTEAKMQLMRQQMQHQLAVQGMQYLAAEHLAGGGMEAPTLEQDNPMLAQPKQGLM